MMENEGRSNECRRLDWQRNRTLIEGAISGSIVRDERLPTYREIEMETGLSQATIARHRPGQMFEEMRMLSRFLGAKVLEQQALRALTTGKAKDTELYFRLNFGWKG